MQLEEEEEQEEKEKEIHKKIDKRMRCDGDTARVRESVEVMNVNQ